MRRISFRTVAVLGALVIPLPLFTSGVSPARAEQPRAASYHVTQLGSLGGTTSAGSSINNRGWIAGLSNLPGDETTHATLWRDGSTPINLGTLGGPNSAVLWPVKNSGGMIAGVAETAEMNPFGETWSCSAFFPPPATGNICLGFVWQHGHMRPLPTLGGPDGFATGVNNGGQVVGWAENTVHDPTCNEPQVLQFRAVRWDSSRRAHELPPLAGDTTSAATAINDSGQVVGISGICADAVGGYSAAHAVIWEKGEATDLGNLGGVAWNTPMAINRQGEVVGFANLPDGDPGAFNAHAFLWTEEEGMRDLGTLPGDAFSEALGINRRHQVVGLSCTAGFGSCRAFIWEDGVMTDLSELAPGYEGSFVFANDINDAGEITGQAIDAETGDAVTFLASPLRGTP
jgi:probable HAF family extracellular repeat protein